MPAPRPALISLAGRCSIALRMPATVIKATCTPYLERGKPAAQTALQNLGDHDIVAAYRATYRGISLWGSTTPSRPLSCGFAVGRRSCCPLVLADQSAQDPPPPDSRHRKVGGRGHGGVVAVRWPQVPCPVRPMPVVLGGVLIQDHAQVPRPRDQHPVGDLRPDGEHPPFGVSVAPHRQLHLIRSIGTDASG
jgi:hypothetical protein